MSSAYMNMLKSYNSKSSGASTQAAKLNNNSSNHTATASDEVCNKLEFVWRETCKVNSHLSISEDRSSAHDSQEQGFQKLGLLMIIIDELPHEAIWRIWSETRPNTSSNTEISFSSSSSSASVQDSPLTYTIPSAPLQSDSNVSFFIHAKYPDKITSTWVRDRIVKGFHLQPGWGSLTLTEVMIRLLHEAVISDPSITSFCFVSETCIPIRPLPDVIKLINSSSSYSWLKYTFEPDNGYAKHKQFDALIGKIPQQCIAKSDQWMLISRQHALDILALSDRVCNTLSSTVSSMTTNIINSQLINGTTNHNHNTATSVTSKQQIPTSSSSSLPFLLKSQFSKVNASDEMYFASCLTILGHIQKYMETNSCTDINRNNNKIDAIAPSSSLSTTISSINDQFIKGSLHNDHHHHHHQSLNSHVLRRRMTYSVWVNMGDRSPKTFTSLDENEIQTALMEGCLFFRKLLLPSSSTMDSSSINSSSNRSSSNNNRKESNARVSETGLTQQSSSSSSYAQCTVRLNMFENWLEKVMNIHKPVDTYVIIGNNNIGSSSNCSSSTNNNNDNIVGDAKSVLVQQQHDKDHGFSWYTYYMTRAKNLIDDALNIHSAASADSNNHHSHHGIRQPTSATDSNSHHGIRQSTSTINTNTSTGATARIQKRQRVEEVYER